MKLTRSQFLRGLGATALTLGVAPRLFAQTQSTVPAAPASGVFINHGLTDGMKIALTLDDGPNPKLTEKILAELGKRKIRATYFLIGRNVAAFPDLTRAMVGHGHEIANHTFTHPTLSRLSASAVTGELRRGQDALHAATGLIPNLFRPPYGAFRRSQAPLAVAENLDILMWSVDTRDWSQPGVEKIQATIRTETQPGSIILLHELHAQTLSALPGALDELQGRGFEFVTTSEILGRKRPAA